MTKNEFLKKLRCELSRMKNDEREKSIAYYSELIDDKIESGMTEEQAISSLEAPENISRQILSDAAERGAIKPGRRPLNIILLAVGSPLWVALIIAAFAVILSLYISAWAVIAAFFATDLSFAIAFIGCLAGFVFYIGINAASAAAIFGAGLVCAGLSMLLFVPLIKLTVLFASFTKKTCTSLWNKYIRKDGGEQ